MRHINKYFTFVTLQRNLSALAMRPEVIEILNAHDNIRWKWDVISELSVHNRAGNIYHWVGPEDMPSAVLRQFDFVILSALPKSLWEDGGMVRPSKCYCELPQTIKGRKHGITFFAGWERKSPVAPPIATLAMSSPFPRPPTPQHRTLRTNVFTFPPREHDSKSAAEAAEWFTNIPITFASLSPKSPKLPRCGIVDYADTSDDEDEYAFMPKLETMGYG